jgi:solute carrier family 44 (choline transporter-like protein), member 2/4/5
MRHNKYMLWGILLLQIAITGKGFCKASVLATGLIMNNILRVGKVNVIGDVILLLGKLCVSLLCALFAFLMLDEHKYRSGHNKISSPLVPVLVSDHQALQHMVELVQFG